MQTRGTSPAATAPSRDKGDINGIGRAAAENTAKAPGARVIAPPGRSATVSPATTANGA